MFETEWSTYLAHKPELLKDEGRYVVIRADEILGTFATTGEAFEAAIHKYGTAPFFMHRIAKVEPETFTPPFVGMLSLPAQQGYVL